jgi:hypothetical protein
MRTATTVIIAMLSTGVMADDNKLSTGLWRGGESLLAPPKSGELINLVPDTVTQTGLDGVKLFNDRDRSRYGSVIDIGNGMWLVNTQGAQNSLTICQKDSFGNTICN